MRAPKHLAPRSGIAAGLIVVALSASIVLTSCIQIGPPSHASAATTDPVVAWLRQHADRLATFAPGGSDADLQPLAAMVGNANIVGLGEATHGTHEIIEMKARLMEFLVTQMHFTTFVMENPWGFSRLVDAYINGGTQPLADVMRAGLYTSWQTQEYADMLTWMRAYNADPAHTTKLHFYGMDIQYVTQGDFDAVEGYVRSVDASQLARVQQLYASINASALPYAFGYLRLSGQTRQQYQQQAQQVYDLLSTHQQTYTSRSAANAFALALQNARIIVQFATLMSEGGVGAVTGYIQRDAFMAENVSWIYDHLAVPAQAGAGGSPKLIVWAHDAHIANDAAYEADFKAGIKNMGAMLRARFQSAYLPIGTAFYQGAITAFGQGTSTQAVGAAGEGTYNYTLEQVGFSPYLVDLRTTPPGAVSKWANGPSVFVYYGRDAENLSDYGPLKQWFDVLVFIRDSTPSRPIA